MRRHNSPVLLQRGLQSTTLKNPLDPKLRRRALRDAYKKYSLWVAQHPEKTPSAKERKKFEKEFTVSFDAGLKTDFLRKKGISALQETNASKSSFEERLAYLGGTQGAFNELDLLFKQGENKVNFFDLRRLKKETLKILKIVRAKKSLSQRINSSSRYYLLTQSINSLKYGQIFGRFIFFKGPRAYKVQFDPLYYYSKQINPPEIISMESVSIFNPRLNAFVDSIKLTTKHQPKTRPESISNIDPILKKLMVKAMVEEKDKTETRAIRSVTIN